MDANLTLAGFIGLGSLILVALGLVIQQMRRSSDLHERMARLEEKVLRYMDNGFRHER